MGTNEKRYFWLKLKEDFFDDKQIKYLRSLPDGDKVLITYLKMQLKSLKTAGTIRYDRILPSSEDELALMLDEDINIVKFTIKALVQINAIEILQDDSIYMIAMQELIGNEGASAERVRRYRENKKALQCNTSVTASNKCNELCHGEIEVDIELEKELKKEKELDAEVEKEKKKNSIFKLCKEKEIELSTNAEEYISNCLNNGMTPEIIVYAISESVDHQVKNWSYVQKILERYKFEGYTTVEEVKRDSMERNQSNLPTYTKKFYNQFYAN